MNSSKILNHIQTLRAFSVLIVFLYHSNLEIFSSGYLGVDIFFVISGYVISSRILNFDLTKDNVDLKNFYVKRAKRIIPNLVFIVSICYIAYLLLGPSDQTIFSAAIFSILGVSNLYYINNSRDYFDNIFIDPLGHTWSLGVEEQFYIFFPILIFFIFKFSNQKLRNLKIFFIIIFVISLFFYYLNYKENPQFSFYFSPLRFWEFLLGSLAYIYREKVKKKNFYFILSILTIVIILFFDNYFDYFIKNLLTVISASLFIIHYSKVKIIENRNLVYLGNISYSFYLWHLPVIFFCDLYFLNNYFIDVILAFLISLFLSAITYKYIEQKFRYIELNNNFYFKIISMVFATFAIFVVYLKYFDNNLRKEVRNFITNINYPQIKFNWSKRANFQNQIKVGNNKVYEFCAPETNKFTLNNYNLRKECLKFKNNNYLFFIKGNSHTAQFLPLFNQSKIIDNFYIELSNISSFSGFDNNLSNYFTKIYLVTNINELEELEFLKKEFLNQDKNLNLIIFNSRPTTNATTPFKCLIQQIDCFIEREKNIKDLNLDILFFELEKFRKENKKRVFIFDSYEAICPSKNLKCFVYDNSKDILYYRDSGHLLPEGIITIMPQFEDFLIKNKIF